MRAVGIICEYNPFHNGHRLQIARARELSKADAVICVMSGAVTQRGTFSRHDKWTRAKAALLGGADLVLELPVRFACSPAGEFASGGVHLLESLGVVNALSFGCETKAIPFLSDAAKILREEPSGFTESLHLALSKGLSYPAARAEALGSVTGNERLPGILSQPNASLGLEYLRVLPETMSAIVIPREGNSYYDPSAGMLASATAIRQELALGQFKEAACALPFPDLFLEAEETGHIHEEDALSQLLIGKLRTMKNDAARNIAGMSEGLENRILAASRLCSSRKELLDAVKTRRYPLTRLSRALTSVLLDMTADFCSVHSTPTYARILGFRKSASPLLREIEEKSSVPLIRQPAGFSEPLLELDIRAQDLWSLGCTDPAFRKCGTDMTHPMVIIP